MRCMAGPKRLHVHEDEIPVLRVVRRGMEITIPGTITDDDGGFTCLVVILFDSHGGIGLQVMSEDRREDFTHLVV